MRYRKNWTERGRIKANRGCSRTWPERSRRLSPLLQNLARVMALKVQGYCENTWCGHVIYFSNSQADGQVKLFTASQSDAVTPFYNLVAMYSAPTLDHFQNPRNAGDLPDPDAAVEIENPGCGDVLRLTLKVSSGRISEVRFKAKGCAVRR